MYNPSKERLESECSIWLTNKQARKFWTPKMFNRQFEIFNSVKRAILAAGPRFSGKTLAVMHKICRHLWDTPGARFAMFSKTLKASKDGGTWDDINKIVIPEWVGAGIGFQYTTVNNDGQPGSKVDGQTRTPFFRVRNRFGGESECKLFSLDHDHDIEDKIKEQRFSGIYFAELDKFKDRKVLSISLAQLRMPHLSYDQHIWIADTNPSEEGEESWIYEVWYAMRTMEYSTYAATCAKNGDPVMELATFLDFQNMLELIEIRPEENPFLDPREIETLKHTYAYDRDLYARYVEGKWTLGAGAAGRHFNGYFSEAKHVKGDCSPTNEDEWITILPSPTSTELLTGWDLGETNHSAHIVDKIGNMEKAHYHVVDELVSIKTDLSIRDFTEFFMNKLVKLEQVCGRQFSTDKNWSDRSSIEKYSATADTYPYLEVYAASGSRIFLAGVPKGPGSVRQRVRAIKRLLREGRLKVSAHCTATIAMLKFLRKGDSEINYVVPDKHKHVFDSLSYMLLMEMSEDFESQADNFANLGKRTNGLAVSIT